MITKLAKEHIIEIGSRNRAHYLVEQAGYTLGLARMDGEALTELLPNGYLEEVTEAAERVAAARKDKALSAEESKSSAQEVNKLVRRAKVWRRTVVNRANRSQRLGGDIPDGLLKTGGVKSVPAVAAQVETMVKLMEANIGKLSGANTQDLIAEGKKLATDIKTYDATQEVNRLKNLPDTVRSFYHEKGLLFVGLKVINDAGHELHADDPANSTKYNLSILYRHTGKRKAEAAATA